MPRTDDRHLIYRLLITLMIAFFGSVFIMSIIDIFSGNNNDNFIAFAFVYIILLLLLVSYLVLRIKNEKAFLILLIAVAFTVRLIWILTVNTVPESDYEVMYNAARMGAKGDFSFSTDSYFTQWAYQMGFTLYQSLIISAFGQGTFPLKLMNCIISTGTTVLVYRIAGTVFNEKAARVAGILYTLYLPTVIINSVLTNQILSAFLIYLAIYMFLSNQRGKIYIYVLVGAVFALGQCIRPLATLALACFAFYELIEYILSKDKKLIIGTCLTLATYFVILAVVGNVLVSSKISQYGLENREPLWKFVIGLNSETTGQYSDDDAHYVKHFPLGEERNKAEQELIKERTENKEQLKVLMLNKYSLMWGTQDSTVYWSSNFGVKELTVYTGIYEQVMYIIAALLAMLAALAMFRQRNKKLYFFMLLIFLYMTAHLFIEIQTRYRDFILPSIFIFTGYGMYLCVKPKQRKKEEKPAACIRKRA